MMLKTLAALPLAATLTLAGCVTTNPDGTPAPILIPGTNFDLNTVISGVRDACGFQIDDVIAGALDWAGYGSVGAAITSLCKLVNTKSVRRGARRGGQVTVVATDRRGNRATIRGHFVR